MSIEGSSAVAVGTDAAVVANHHVVVRRAVAGGPGEKRKQFVVAPTLSGVSRLTRRLAAYPGALANAGRRPGRPGAGRGRVHRVAVRTGRRGGGPSGPRHL